MTELANSGVSIGDAAAASAAAQAMAPAPVSTDPGDLRHELELMKERVNSLVALLTPYHRGELGTLAPL